MPEISTLLQSLIAYLDQQTLESKYYMALHAVEPAVAEPAVAEPVAPAKKTRTKAVTESVKAEPAVAEPAVAEPAVAEPAVAEPAVAEPSVAAHREFTSEGPQDNALPEKDAKAVAQYQADAAHAIALDEAKAKAKADAARLAAMNAEPESVKAEPSVAEPSVAELDYEKDVAPAIRNHAIDVNKRGAVMDALLTYGVKNGKSLAPKDYASFLQHLEEQVAAAALGLDWYDYMDSLEA